MTIPKNPNFGAAGVIFQGLAKFCQSLHKGEDPVESAKREAKKTLHELTKDESPKSPRLIQVVPIKSEPKEKA